MSKKVKNNKLHTKTKKHTFKKNKKKSNKKLLKNQTFGIGPKLINSIIIGLDEDDKSHVCKIAEGLDEYDLAHLIETLDIKHRLKFIEFLGKHINPDVLPELNDTVQEQVIDSLDEEQIVDIVNELDSEEAVEVLEHLDGDEQETIISKLEPELKHQVQSSLSYPEDSAGRIMSREFVSMPDDWTVKEAKQFLLSDTKLPEDFYTVFLTDEKMHPTGQITLDKLLRAKPDVLLKNIMDYEIVPINVCTDQEEVAHMFREYGWMSGIVVDGNNRLIGVINIDDVVDIVHEEANEDMMHLSGAGEGDVYKSVGGIFRSRIGWLFINLFAVFMASFVVKGFEDIIAQASFLAVLMPIVASMSGTTGQQTLAVVVRAIATKELTSRNTLRMIGKEFGVGLLNGLLFAVLIAGVTCIVFPHQYLVSLIIAIAMLCNLCIASLAGILIPLTMERLHFDPAAASGVFLIAITDSGGFFIFLGLAKLILF